MLALTKGNSGSQVYLTIKLLRVVSIFKRLLLILIYFACLIARREQGNPVQPLSFRLRRTELPRYS